jgi:hypothetical protein
MRRQVNRTRLDLIKESAFSCGRKIESFIECCGPAMKVRNVTRKRTGPEDAEPFF